jgi:hypothetical protein
MVVVAIILAAALSACAHEPETALTQWGTPCSDYGLSPKACHAKFADYAHYMAQPDSNSAASKSNTSQQTH